MKSILSKNDVTKKEVVLDLNINLLGFDKNKRVQSFVNLIFRFGMIPMINKAIHFKRNQSNTFLKEIFQSIDKFKQKLRNIGWNNIKILQNINDVYQFL